MSLNRTINLLLILLIISIPFYGFSFINFNNRGIPVSWILSFFIITVIFIKIRKNKLTISIMELLLTFFIIESFFTIFNIFEYGVSNLISFSTLFLQYCLRYLILMSIIRARININIIYDLVKTWIYISLLVGLYGFYQGIARLYKLPFYNLSLTNKSFSASQRMGGYGASSFLRVTSIFGEPSWYGAYIIVSIIFLITFFLYHKDNFVLFNKKFMMLSLLFLIICLIQTGSIGAYISFVLVLSIIIFHEIFLFKNKMVSLKVLFLIIILVIFILVFVLISDYQTKIFLKNKMIKILRLPLSIKIIDNKIITETNIASLGYRLEMITSSLMVWEQSSLTQKIFGKGLNYLESSDIYTYDRRAPLNSAPNNYTKVLIDQGILGLIILIFFLLYIVIRYILDYKKILFLYKNKMISKYNFYRFITLSNSFYYIIWYYIFNFLVNIWKIEHWIIFGLFILISKNKYRFLSYNESSNSNKKL